MFLEWSLREELLAVSHRWPLPVLAFLIGSLIGYGFSFLLPTPYRSEVDLFVAYNGDAIYRNPDDHKNWHLNQLNDLAYSDSVLQETLDRLRMQDPYWQGVDLQSFKDNAEVLWRNTGRWRLMVQDGDPFRSQAAAHLWATVFLERYNAAVEASRQVLVLDHEIQSLSDAQSAVETHYEGLLAVWQRLDDWRAALAASDPAVSLDDLGRWEIWSQANEAQVVNPAWEPLMAEMPPAAAPAGAFLFWVERALRTLDAELQSDRRQIDGLEMRKAETMTVYESAFEASLGLSSTVEVERLAEGPNPAWGVRPTGLTVLVGGILGFLAWGLIWLLRPLRLRSSIVTIRPSPRLPGPRS